MSRILVGDTILILATVFGAGTLLKLYPSVFDVIKLIGGCYLAYLGIRLIIGAYHTFKNRHLIANQSFNPAKVANQNYFHRSLSLSLTNPKAILFLLSFFCAVCQSDLRQAVFDVFCISSDFATYQLFVLAAVGIQRQKTGGYIRISSVHYDARHVWRGVFIYWFQDEFVVGKVVIKLTT